ncbi:MAG: hypothetical protein QOJ89_3567 [bacterium]
MTRTVAILSCAATCLLIAVPAAPASLRQRITAANKVERKLTIKQPRYTWVAACTQPSSTRFRCRFSGRRGTRGATGRAVVNRIDGRYVVTLGRITYS